MRVALACAVLCACGGPDPVLPIDGGDDDAAGDAGADDEEPDPGPAIAAPLSCADGGTLPELPPVCIDGWCVEAPHPLAHAGAVLGFAGERWFALPTHLIQIAGGQATAFPLPAGQVGDLVGSAQAGIWTFSAATYRAMRFDGTDWHVMPQTGGLTLVPLAANDAWAINYRQVLHGDGASWQAEVLPQATADASLTAIAASSSNHVWVGATRYDAASEQLMHYLLHRDHGVWSATAVPWPILALWASGPHNLWLSTGSAIVHYDGTTFVEQFAVEASMLTGRSRNDVWSLASGPNANVSHWDGVSWTTCARPGVRTLALGDGEVWTAGEDHALARYAGQWASVPQLHGVQAMHRIAGSTEVLAGGADVMLRRTDAGAWTPETGFPLSYVVGIESKAPDRIWAFGTGAARFDGASWLDTQPPGSISTLCIGDGEHVFASSYASSLYFDGQSWSTELALAPGDGVLCTGTDDVWIGNGVETSIAHRVDGRWVRTATEPWVGRTQLVGTSLWTIANNALMAVVDGEWMAVDLTGAAALLPAGTLEVRDVTSTAANDTWLLVDLRTSPVDVDQYLVHYDGAHYDRALQRNGAKKIAALAPDDLIIIGARFETERLTAGVATTLFAGFAADHALGYGSGVIRMFSATNGWAISDESRLLRFDGASWAVATTAPVTYARGLFAPSASDLWVHDASAIHRFNGIAWTTTPIALLPNESLIGMWAASPADVWLTTTAARVLHVVAGVATVVTVAADAPYELGLVGGTSADDVWFSGTYLEQFQYKQTVYHWDGSTLQRYRTLRRAIAMRRIAGELFATAYDFKYGQEVWQRVGTRWLPRPDLAPASVFADLFGRPLPPYGHNRGVGGGPWYAFSDDPYAALGAQVIWRRP